MDYIQINNYTLTFKDILLPIGLIVFYIDD